MLTAYQKRCQEMYKTGKFDLVFITKGFVDNEIDFYKPQMPNGMFEHRIKTFLRYMTEEKFRQKARDKKEQDKRAFEADNREHFIDRREVMSHNKRSMDILKSFLNDLPLDDIHRRSILKKRLDEFNKVIKSMPEYKEPASNTERGFHKAGEARLPNIDKIHEFEKNSRGLS